MGELGWPFASVDPFPAADPDPLYNAHHIKDLYFKADPEYGGRCAPIRFTKTAPPTVAQVYRPGALGQENAHDRQQ